MEVYLEDNRPTLDEVCMEYEECVEECPAYEFCNHKAESEDNELRRYAAKVINRGNCMICGKELTEGLFFCKECEEKGRK